MLNPSINRRATTRVTKLSTILAGLVITLSLASVTSYPQDKGTAAFKTATIQNEKAALQTLLSQQQSSIIQTPAPQAAPAPQPAPQPRQAAPRAETPGTQIETVPRQANQSSQVPQPTPQEAQQALRELYSALENQFKQQALTQRSLEEIQKTLTAPEDLRRQIEDLQRALKLQAAATSLEQQPTKEQLNQLQVDILNLRREMQRSVEETRRMMDELNRRLDSLQRAQQ